MPCNLTPGGPDLEPLLDLDLFAKFTAQIPVMPLQVLELLVSHMNAQIKLLYIKSKVSVLESFKEEGGLHL